MTHKPPPQFSRPLVPMVLNGNHTLGEVDTFFAPIPLVTARRIVSMPDKTAYLHN